MDAFSYLSVLLSIILGLAITQILKGFRGLVLSRANVVIYWPTIGFAILLMMVNVQSWWAMFAMRDIAIWTFPKFAIVLLQSIALYMLAALVLPDFFGTQTVNLREHYFAHRKVFFVVLVSDVVISLSKDLVLSGHLTDNANLAFHIFFLAVGGIAALTAKEWYHKLLCVVSLLAYCAYIGLLFARLK